MRLDEITKEMKWRAEGKGWSPRALWCLEIRKKRRNPNMTLLEQPESEKESKESVLLWKPRKCFREEAITSYASHWDKMRTEN